MPPSYITKIIVWRYNTIFGVAWYLKRLGWKRSYKVSTPSPFFTQNSPIYLTISLQMLKLDVLYGPYLVDLYPNFSRYQCFHVYNLHSTLHVPWLHLCAYMGSTLLFLPGKWFQATGGQPLLLERNEALKWSICSRTSNGELTAQNHDR